jgi:hypothetical protein
VGVELAALAATLPGHVLADVLPEVAKDRHLVARNILGDGHAGQLHDPALDGVHEGEIAHRPREKRPFRITGAAQEEGRGREVDHTRDAELAVRVSRPEIQRRAAWLFFSASFFSSPFSPASSASGGFSR